MSKNITIEVGGIPTAYNNKSILEVPLTDGSGYAKYQDIDEFDGSGLESQVVGCDASISDFGGIKFAHTGTGRALYIGIPDRDPDSTLIVNRFAYAIMVEVFEDGTVYACCLGYSKMGMGAAGAALSDGIITVPGSSGYYLTNTEVKYTFRKFPL